MMHVPDEHDEGTRALEPPVADDCATLDTGATSIPTSGSATRADPGSDPGAADDLGFHGPPRVGQVIGGQYVFERQIGAGGMGTVWLVRHLELDALRALKLIISGVADDPQVRARVRREARAMARLSHPNAVAVHNARIGRDLAFIEMEYVRGLGLNRLLTAGLPMPLDWTARILELLCDVLQEAHDQKIVHRDLKPSNLMLVADRPPARSCSRSSTSGSPRSVGRRPRPTPPRRPATRAPAPAASSGRPPGPAPSRSRAGRSTTGATSTRSASSSTSS